MGDASTRRCRSAGRTRRFGTITALMSDSSIAARDLCGPGLMVVFGPVEDRIGATLRLVAEQRLTIGRRSPEFSGGGIGDARISSKHFEVCLKGEELEVRDLDSKNGLLFNGRRLFRAQLQDGQIFQVGSTFLAFRTELPLTSHEGSRLVGNGLAISRVRERAAHLAKQTRPISIAGPVGSEKELVAAELHRLSERRGEFIARDLAGIPSTRREHVLFGDEGAWLEAREGTVFLEGIELLSATDQSRLAKMLFTPREHAPAVVVALKPTDVASGSRAELDPELLGLLSLAQIEAPTLMERREDLGALVRYCLARSGYDHLGISERLMWALFQNPWPGELRALERLLNNLAMSVPRGNDSLDLNPTAEAYLEQQFRLYSPRAMDDSTIDIIATN